MLKRFSLKTIAVCKTDTFSSLSHAGKPRVNGHWYICSDKLDIHLCRLNIAPPHAFLFNRELLADIGLFKEHYGGCEDYDFWLRALGKGYHFRYCGTTRVFYRKHQKSKGATKAQTGAFPFDVKVHTHMHTGYYGEGVSNIIKTPIGKLAMSSGTLATAIKIDPRVNASGRLHLAELSCHYLTSALDQMSWNIDNRSLETRLYFRRLLCLKNSAESLHVTSLDNALNRLTMEAGGSLNFLTDVLKAFPYSKYQQQALVSCALKSLLQ